MHDLLPVILGLAALPLGLGAAIALALLEPGLRTAARSFGGNRRDGEAATWSGGASESPRRTRDIHDS